MTKWVKKFEVGDEVVKLSRNIYDMRFGKVISVKKDRPDDEWLYEIEWLPMKRTNMVVEADVFTELGYAPSDKAHTHPIIRIYMDFEVDEASAAGKTFKRYTYQQDSNGYWQLMNRCSGKFHKVACRLTLSDESVAKHVLTETIQLPSAIWKDPTLD